MIKTLKQFTQFKQFKHYTVAAATAAMLFTLAMPNTVAAENASGTDWAISGNTLTISSQAGMIDWQSYHKGGLQGGPVHPNSTTITTVILQNGVTDILEAAFRNFTALTTVNFPTSGLTRIGTQAFFGCTELVSVDIPNSVTSFGNATFMDCAKLTTANIPTGLTTVSNSAFRNTGFTSIVIPDNITTIANSAFSNCSALAAVEISANVSTLHSQAFAFCPALTVVIFKGALPSTSTSTSYSNIFDGSPAVNIVVPTAHLAAYRTAFSSFTVTDTPVTTYTVTYDLNGGGGTIPTEPSKPAFAQFIVPEATHLIPPAGYRFKEWNTAADGSGKSYSRTLSPFVIMPAHNLILYAIWEGLPFTFQTSDGLICQPLTGTTVSITGLTGNPTSLTIPATVTHEGTTYNVTEIGYRAFLNNDTIQRVVIEGSVSIGMEAFALCDSLSYMRFLHNTPPTVNSSFGGTNIDKAGEFSIVVPAGRVSAYQSAFSTNANAANFREPATPTRSNGTITTANVAATTLTLNWTAATDGGATLPANMKYRIYQSSSNNIGSISNAETNGALIGTVTGVTTFDVTGLTAGTTYYFNIVAENIDENKVAYIAESEATLSPPTIAVTATGLTGLKVGQAVSGAYIAFDLTNGTFANPITNANFNIGNLPPGLTTGTINRQSNTQVRVEITGTPTAASTTARTITLPANIPAANVTGAASAITPTGTLTASAVEKGNGAQTSEAFVSTVTPPTANSITVDAVTFPLGNPGNQVPEYAYSTNASGPSSAWQDGRTFTGLIAGTTYYIWARSKENANYNAGLERGSVGITTPTPAITVTASGLGNLKVGVPLSSAFIRYWLTNGTFSSSFNPADFDISNLPAGITVQAITRDASNTVTHVSLTGTPTTHSATPPTNMIPSTIPNSNIVENMSGPVAVTNNASVSAVAKGDMSGGVSIVIGNEGGGTAGVAEVGDILSVDISGIIPAAAQAGVTYSWDNGVDPAVTTPTYTVTAADGANRREITITVTADAGGNYGGSLSYFIKAGVALLTGTATISNTSPRIGDVLTGSLVDGNNTGTLAYAWKAGGTAVGTNAAAYTIAATDFGKVITLEITSDVEIGTRTSEPTAAVLKKAAPNAPSAPIVASKTHNRVTLTPTAGYEYSMDGADWQTGNEFTGLTANTPYTFYQRIAETADTEASVASPALNVTTEPTTGIASNDRNIPQSMPNQDAAVIAPVSVSAFEVSVGPNPVRRGDGGIVNIFITGKRVDNGTLTVFDGSGNVINKITIRDNVIGGNGGRRIVGNWDLKDAKGKVVSDGTYLLRGSVKTVDGRRERASVVVSVR